MARPDSPPRPSLARRITPRGAAGALGLGSRLVAEQPIRGPLLLGPRRLAQRGRAGREWGSLLFLAPAPRARSGPATCAPTPAPRASRNPPLVRTREPGAAACNAALSGSDLGRALSFSVPGFLILVFSLSPRDCGEEQDLAAGVGCFLKPSVQ